MISFEDIRPQLKKFVQEGSETADYIMRVSKTPKDGIYAYEELGEIVRCRDCKHYYPHGVPACQRNRECVTGYDINGDYGDWYFGEFYVEPDGFCAWGERKAVGHDGA